MNSDLYITINNITLLIAIKPYIIVLKKKKNSEINLRSSLVKPEVALGLTSVTQD